MKHLLILAIIYFIPYEHEYLSVIAFFTVLHWIWSFAMHVGEACRRDADYVRMWG